MDNVLISGIAKTQHEAFIIARDAIGHFIGHLMEAMRASEVITRDNWREYVTIEMSPACEKCLFNPTGPVVIATAHLGSWEAAVCAVSSVRPLMVLARMMDNPYIQKFLERHNLRGGATVLPQKHGFSSSAIHRWTMCNGALAILCDQHCRHGLEVPFFGHQLPSYSSPARLHLRTGAPIIVGGFIRTGTLRYKMVAVGDPITGPVREGSTKEATYALTAEILHRLEDVIRMAPDQYLWLHNRFRGIKAPKVPKR